MPILKFSRVTVLTLFISSVSVHAQETETVQINIDKPPQITIRVVDIDPPTGQVEVSLFTSAENFMTEPVYQTRIPVDGNLEVDTAFRNPPAGEYAVVVVHDANENGELDRGFLGIGGEGYGFSNNVRPWFGWPSFEEASFSATSEGAEIEISIK